MKLKKGEYTIDTPLGEIDLFDLVKNKDELGYIEKVKETLVTEGLYPEAKQGQLCVNSICAFIIYLDELSILIDDSDPKKTDQVH
jgi:hypothetical protein